MARGHGTVLVVDDDATVRNVAQRMLERFGFDVVTAADGVEAVAVYQKDPEAFSLVLLDLTMPHLDGGATAGKILQLNPRARIVLMSGYTDEELSKQFAGAGFSAFLQKPFRLGVVQQLLREVLESGEGTG
jgi:CheY-like chemotaxis protein